MSYSLVELGRTRHQTSAHLVFEDYNAHPMLCRHGLWVGWSVMFAETVLLSLDHGSDDIYVGWAINGTTVVDPGYGSGTPPWGMPAPGVSSVTYVTPVSGLFHQLSLTSTPGDGEECLWIQSLYRTPEEAGAPAHMGPAQVVCLSGSEITWPSDKLEEERKCLEGIYKRLRQYLQVAHINPGDPVEQWLRRVRGDDAVRILAELDTLEKLDAGKDRELDEAIRADLARMVQGLMPGAGGRIKPPSGR